ncbi:hypothetical protein NDU88_001889 [Pleurodeles waltl]|uniref:Uncharacterized protein n=1 Tax=Pleurodeles waltl TaxID=8319 RepID=A0AAV7SE27_PLEWA|nr:hypothetical protein NDU88_001889 [Pleurodeles waltl]
MPPKRSVLCRPPRLLPHNAAVSTVHRHRQSPLSTAHKHRLSPPHRHRKSLVSAVYKHRQSPLLCSVFAPSLPPHLVTVSLPLLGARDPRSRLRQSLALTSPRVSG